jgi:Flp pilus assembly pilin Flp
LLKRLRHLSTGASGQDLVEYAMLMAFVALVCIIGLQNMGTAVNNTYNAVSVSLGSSLGS